MQLSDLNCSLYFSLHAPPTTFDFISIVDGLFTLFPFEFFFHFCLYMCFTWQVSLLSLRSQKNAFIWRLIPLFSLFKLFPSVFFFFLSCAYSLPAFCPLPFTQTLFEILLLFELSLRENMGFPLNPILFLS